MMETLIEIQKALRVPNLDAVERNVLVLAIALPGTHSIAAVARDWGTSEAFVQASVKKLGKKGHIEMVKPLDGFVNLVPMELSL